MGKVAIGARLTAVRRHVPFRLRSGMKFTRALLLSAVVAGALGLAGCVEVAHDKTPQPRTISVAGTATVKVVPDELRWSVGVGSKGQTPAIAKSDHDVALKAALAYLKGIDHGMKDLQSSGISVQQDLWPMPNGQRNPMPYSCFTDVSFTLTDFDNYSNIADALSKIDGVQITSTTYASSKEIETRHNALNQALQNAREKASRLAETAGCTLGQPLQISEAGAQVQLTYAASNSAYPPAGNSVVPDGANSASSTGLVAGQIEITASVNATYELIQK